MSKLTKEQKLYMQSMDSWFKSMELTQDIMRTELGYFQAQIEYYKKRIALQSDQLKKSVARRQVAVKEFTEWKKINKIK